MYPARPNNYRFSIKTTNWYYFTSLTEKKFNKSEEMRSSTYSDCVFTQ